MKANELTAPPFPESHYHQRDSDDNIDEKDFFLPGSTSKHKAPRSWLAIGLTLIITAASLVIAAAVAYDLCWTTESNSNPDKHNGQWTNCGLTVDDALARNCKFDMMGNNWVPPLCHDETFAKSAATGNESIASLFGIDEFQWYGKPRVDSHLEDLQTHLIAKARRGEEVFAFTTESWHIAHCMYWFSVAVNAMNRLVEGERDVWVPRVVKKPHHARHCSSITGRMFKTRHFAKEEEPINSKVFFGYATCVPLA